MRLVFFALAMVGVVLAIGGAAQTAWTVARRVKETFSPVELESFQIADHFQATILELNGELRRYSTSRGAASWNQFVRQSEDLDQWIDRVARRMRNPREIDLLAKINTAYDAYRANAHQLTNSAKGAASDGFDRIEAESKSLLGLGNKLADEHRQVVGVVIDKTQQSLAVLQKLIFGLLVLLVMLGAWLAVVVYLEMIAPLRVKLVESQTIIERQEKLASLGVLAAGLAHEIRNPLTAIKARLFTQQKALTPESREFKDAVVIGGEINRLESIVKSVLQFARPSEPSLATVRIRQLLADVRDLMAPQLEENAIQLESGATPDIRIRGDAAQLRQVLINLVQNAAESIGRSGTVSLRARLTDGRLKGRPQPVVILEVSDTGKGIPAAVEKRLFDPFFTTKEGGTGLGLAISARIVEKHGGALEFQTQVNCGTTFGIVLPLQS
jgi:signal transduction histidine kinase